MNKDQAMDNLQIIRRNIQRSMTVYNAEKDLVLRDCLHRIDNLISSLRPAVMKDEPITIYKEKISYD